MSASCGETSEFRLWALLHNLLAFSLFPLLQLGNRLDIRLLEVLGFAGYTRESSVIAMLVKTIVSLKETV